MGNKLKEVFSNQEISYKGKISFKNKEAYEDFIEMGVRGVDTLQPEAKNMDPRYLKEHFGGSRRKGLLDDSVRAVSFTGLGKRAE